MTTSKLCVSSKEVLPARDASKEPKIFDGQNVITPIASNVLLNGCILPQNVVILMHHASFDESGKVIPSTKSSMVVDLLKTWRDPLTGDPKAKVLVLTTFKESHKLLAASFEEES